MIGVIGDLHFKEYLSYAELFPDYRQKEKQEILDAIVTNLEDVDHVVFMGDIFNARNNPSKVIAELVKFVKLISDHENRELFFIAGNHDKFGDGRSAIDFLKEMREPNWHFAIDKVLKVDNIHFCPYFNYSELGTQKIDTATKKVLSKLPGGDILFIHHTISDTLAHLGISTNLFDEIVLPKKELLKKYKLVVGGHIHNPQIESDLIIAGSVFNNMVGEEDSYLWKIIESDITKSGKKYHQIRLPGRSIYKIENPTDLSEYSKDSILKIVITDKKLKPQIPEIRKQAEKFDAYILLEQYPHKRKKTQYHDNIFEYDVDKLLEIYAKEKKIDIKKLRLAFGLINK